jgi:hypothetical protein
VADRDLRRRVLCALMALRHYDRDRLAGVVHDVVLHRKRALACAGAVGRRPTPSSTATMPGLLAKRSGLVCHRVDHQALESAMRARIGGLWRGYAEDVCYLMLNGMRVVAGGRPVRDYLNVSDHIRYE